MLFSRDYQSSHCWNCASLGKLPYVGKGGKGMMMNSLKSD